MRDAVSDVQQQERMKLGLHQVGMNWATWVFACITLVKFGFLGLNWMELD